MTAKEILGEIERHLDASGRRLAVLAGAGISKAPPSNLPTAGEFMLHVVRGLMSPALRPLATELLVPERPNRRHPKDFIRFEFLAEVLAEYAFDTRLSFLDYLADCRAANRNHSILAGLLAANQPVMTTNFDSLIELAYREAGFGDPVVIADEATFARLGAAGDATPLYKLHGSFEVDGRDTRMTLRATLRSIVAAGDAEVMMEPGKFDAFARVVGAHDLLVVGYSGADDFDILPALRRIAAPDRKIIWINHDASQSRLLSERDLAACARDAHGYPLAERVALLQDIVRSGLRRPENVVIAECNTSDVMELVARKFAIVPRAGRGAPHAVDVGAATDRWMKARLPQEPDRWYIGAYLLFERERYTEAGQLLDEAIARFAGDNDRTAKAMQAKVNYMLRAENYDEALKMLEKMAPLVAEHRETQVKAEHAHQKGYVAYNLGERNLFGYNWDLARQHFRTARESLREGYRLRRKMRDAQGMSAALHQLSLVYTRWVEPDRFEAMQESQRFLVISFAPATFAGRVRKWFRGLVRRVKAVAIPLRRWWALRTAERTLRKAMKIAKTAGLWTRYCESAAQMAGVLHVRGEYRREVAVLAEVLQREAVLGTAYLLGGSYGQLGIALRYLREYPGAAAAFFLSMRLTQAGGGVHRAELERALKVLRDEIGSAEYDRLEKTLAPMQNNELADIALGRKALPR